MAPFGHADLNTGHDAPSGGWVRFFGPYFLIVFNSAIFMVFSDLDKGLDLLVFHGLE